MLENKSAALNKAAAKDCTVQKHSNSITLVTSNDLLTAVYDCSPMARESAPDSCFATAVREVPVSSLGDVADLFAEIRADPHCAVILGQYVGDENAAVDENGLVRAIGGKRDSFVDRSSNVITFDVGMSEPKGNGDEIARQMVGVLPKMFHGLDYLWSLKPCKALNRKRMYLTFWMPEPMTLKQVRDLVKREGLKGYQENALPVPSKLIITADPIFEDGMVDPVPVRHGRGEGRGALVRDTLTVLQTLGPVLTKTFCSDGSTLPYGDAANFKVKTAEVTGWDDMRALLGKLHKKPTCGLIRGKLTGTESKKEGTFVRNNANFSDQPLHWFMVDVDGFEPMVDPVHDAELAVLEFIDAVVPALKGASFYWHLSSSAGRSKNATVLKCHIHFLNETAYTTAQMHAWAKTVGKQVDSAVFRRVQFNYTADPVFEEGVEDPVAVRAGFYQGPHDLAKLVITENTLSQAREQGAGEGGQDMKLKIPSEKDGIIGAFHRAFTAEQVLLEHLDQFEQVTDRRYTWAGGGGTPEGVWVHDDGEHVGSSHNTWPIPGIANLWDVVRTFKFGHLDEAEDEFDQLDIDSLPVGHKPSDTAMREWAESLPELQAMMKAERADRAAAIDDLLKRISAAKTIDDLTGPIVEDARTLLAADANAITKARIDSAIQSRAKKLEGVNLPIAAIRDLTKPMPSDKPRSVEVKPGDQLSMARALKNAAFSGNKAIRTKGSWYIYNGRCFEELTSDEKVNNAAWQFLGSAMCRDEEGRLLPVSPNKNMVAGTVDALRSELAVEIGMAPSWLPGYEGPEPAGLLVMANGILDISTSELFDHTPNLFSVNDLPYGFDVSATCPNWMTFLDQVLPGDLESQRLLQEWFGYNLTPDTSQQKFLMIIGQKRSGKGTVGRILHALLGKYVNTIGPSLSSLSEKFGLEYWLGKLAAVIGDSRSGGREPQLVSERILSIVGEDTLTVERKHRGAVSARLPTRITVLSNELLRLGDASGALIGRMLLLEFGQTFYGREDTRLEGKLLKELPGILNWALDGKRRLIERGHFIQPEAGKELLLESSDANSPLTVFIREHCELDPMYEVPLDALFEAWQHYCRGDNRQPGDKAMFSKNLRAAFPEVKKARPRDEKSGRQYNACRGLKLSDEMCEEIRRLGDF